MTQQSHQTAPTQFVEGAGVRFAYRRFGKTGVTPLVFLQHFTGNLDNWDPLITDALSLGREVILFNNAGVASSSGETPNNVAAMAAHAAAFIDSLGLKLVDLFGFSLGGMVAQQVTIDRPDLVRRAVLIGTGPRGGVGIDKFTPEVNHFFFEKKYDDPDELWLDIFFAPTATSQAAGRAFLPRLKARQVNRDIPIIPEKVAPAQLAAVGAWGTVIPGNDHAELKNIKQPVLVINGNNDIIISTINSYVLAQNIPNAQLIIYPDSNHGSQYQFPELFLNHVKLFLDN